MNTKIRIAICFILSLCLLLLPACKGGKVPNPSDTPEQMIDQTDATDHLSQTQMTEATQQSQETEGSQQTENNTEATEPAKTLNLNWKAKIRKGYVLFDMTSIKSYSESMYRGVGLSGIHLDYEGYEKLKADYAVLIANRSDSENPLEEVTYSKEFFEENSLILLNVYYDGYFEIKNLRYSYGIVYCEVDIYDYDRPAGLVRDTPLDYYLFFLEVDADLPEITNVKLDYRVLRLSRAEYDQEIEEFEERLVSE